TSGKCRAGRGMGTLLVLVVERVSADANRKGDGAFVSTLEIGDCLLATSKGEVTVLSTGSSGSKLASFSSIMDSSAPSTAVAASSCGDTAGSSGSVSFRSD